MSDEMAQMTSYLMQTAYLVGVFYQALKDQGLPDSLIESIVRDWHSLAIEADVDFSPDE